MIWEVGGEIRRLPASIETPAVHVVLWLKHCKHGKSSYVNWQLQNSDQL